MDWKAIGKFIAKLRKENGMTQEQLSEKIFCTRESIAKWENGINTPSIETLIKIGEIFDISINEILACKIRTEETKKKIDDMSIKIISESKRKITKIIKISSFTFIFLLLIFLIYYYFNTYNSLYVYRVAGESDIFSTFDGIAIFSKNKSYLKLGNIIGDKNFNSYELVYKDKDGNEKMIFSSLDSNETLISIYNNDGYFSFKSKDEIINSSYLKIKYENQEELVKLNFQRDMVNSFKLFNNINKLDSNSNKTEQKNLNDMEKVDNYFKKIFSYNADEDNYFLNDSDEKIKTKYSCITNVFVK